MPSTSAKQHNFFAAVAKNPKFAKKAGVSQSVGEDFLQADKGRTFKQGNAMKKYAKGGPIIGEKAGKAGLKKGDLPHGEHPIQTKGRTKAKQVAMKRGGKC